MSSVRVRMYRQGLGDSFLLSFASDGSESHLLIDCGVLKGTENAAEKMQVVAEDICATTGGQLDVLVATHEHWDHLSGFLQAEDRFKDLNVAEVWVAWTEDPNDELATELRARKQNAMRGVASAAQALAGPTAESSTRLSQRINAVLDFTGDFAAGGGQTTEAALGRVKGWPGAVVRFLQPGTLVTDVPAGMEGVRVYVLGPPHDRRLIKRSDPSKAHSEVYELADTSGADDGFLAAAGSLHQDAAPGEQPFEGWFRMSAEEEQKDEFLQAHYWSAADEWRRIERDWLANAERLALHLDSDTNNTSLVLAFELGDGRVLLFPGDAQVGNWLSWEQLEWRVKEGATSQKVVSADLLGRTVLYKVGHHASHNATLREKGLELMPNNELVALVPVNRVTAKKMEWNMPFPSLLRRLEEKTRGRILDAELGIPAKNPGASSDADWDRFVARTDVQASWIDYTLEW